jgi:site-specific recombinase XerD
MELPTKEHFESSLHHKVRVNHKPRTIDRSFISMMLFLSFCGTSGKSDIQKIERVDLEAFIEPGQDRGMHISTVRTRLACIVAFLHFLIEHEFVPGTGPSSCSSCGPAYGSVRRWAHRTRRRYQGQEGPSL